MKSIHDVRKEIFREFPFTGDAYYQKRYNKGHRKKLKSNQRRCPRCYGVLEYHSSMKEYKIHFGNLAGKPEVVDELNKDYRAGIQSEKVMVKLYICNDFSCKGQYAFYNRKARCYG